MPLLKEVVPADLHDRPYLRDLLDKEQSPETFGAVFKKLDGAETLIGKRPGIPGKDAKDEEWDKFLTGLKPEKADDYEVPVDKDAKPDEAFLKTLRESFHKGDISKRQAQKFLNDFMPKLKEYSAAQSKVQKDAQAKADADFETLAKAALGEQNKAVMSRVRAAIVENAPAAVKPYVDKLDNNALVIMAGVIDAIMKKYVPEDELNTKGGNDGDGGKSAREQAKALMQSKEYTDPFHPEHDKAKAKVKALYQEAAKAGG